MHAGVWWCAQEDLDELRRRLRVLPAPAPPQHLGFKQKKGKT